MSDGCNSPEKNSVRLCLTASDRDILDKISPLIYPNGRPLSFKPERKTFGVKMNKSYVTKENYCLSINNKHISQTLEKYGLVKAKTLILEFPQWMPEILLSHFIRGYFDGDGCLSISYGRKSAAIYMLGTENFCLGLQNIANKLGINSCVCHAKKGSTIKQFAMNARESCKIFLNWIYKDANLYLDRKYQKYQEAIKVIEEIQNKPKKVCKICGDKFYAKEFCNKHWQQIKRCGKIIN